MDPEMAGLNKWWAMATLLKEALRSCLVTVTSVLPVTNIQDTHYQRMIEFLTSPLLKPEMASWQAKVLSARRIAADTQVRKMAASLSSVHQSTH